MATNGLTERDWRLVAAIASGQSQADASRSTGIPERTVHRRMADPMFRAAVQETRAGMFTAALGALASEAVASVRVLTELRDGADVPPAVRRAAARDVLSVGQQLREAVELEDRLTALEADVVTLTKGGDR